MARLKDYDSRAYMIDKLSNTDNLLVMRRAGRNIDKVPLSGKLTFYEIDKFIKDGVSTMIRLFGSSVESFEPYRLMQEMTAHTFFSKMRDGYRKVEDKRTDHIDYISRLEKAEYELSDALLKHNFKKEFEAKFILDCLKKSEEMYAKRIENEAIIKGEIEVDALKYEEELEMFRFYKKYKDCINLGRREPVIIEEEDDDARFYTEVQKKVANYVLDLFLKGEYFENLHTSPVRYLMDYSGGIKVDYEHLFILHEYLKSVKHSKAKIIEAVLCYFAICRFYFDSQFMTNRKAECLKGFRATNTEFTSIKVREYEHSYFPIVLQPKGFRCYIFEIKNLAQRVYLSSYDKNDISVDNMIDKFNETKKTLNKRTKGLLFPFLLKEDENNLMPFILNGDFPIDAMTGSYSDYMKMEYKERRANFNTAEAGDILTDMYSRVLKPIALDILGSFLSRCCEEFRGVFDTNDINFPFIYYVSAQRIGFAFPDKMSDEEIKSYFKVDVSNIVVPVKIPTFEEVWENKMM